ncbi:Methyltransferase-like protein 23 [Sorochytrium milnesiophthora]
MHRRLELPDGLGPIHIAESIDAATDYGAYTWPSALVLSRFIIAQRDIFAQSACIEIGAGTGLVSLVLCRIGCPRVVITDRSDAPLVYRNIQASLEANGWSDRVGRQVHIAELPWSTDATVEDAGIPPVDYVLGADVFYDEDLFEACFSSYTLTALLQKYGLEVEQLVYARDMLDQLDDMPMSWEPSGIESVWILMFRLQG